MTNELRCEACDERIEVFAPVTDTILHRSCDEKVLGEGCPKFL